MGAIQEFWKPFVYEQILKVCPQVLTKRETKWLKEKHEQILKCADNKKIPRHPEAGHVSGDFQIMHNGLKIFTGCYSTPTNRGMMTHLFEVNKGVHEPSEEFAFQVILETIPSNATIVELGSWWAFYSMWFKSKVANAEAYMVEPEADRLEDGKKNFALNGFQGHFYQYFVGASSGPWTKKKLTLAGIKDVETNQKMICIDDFVAQNGIKFIDILHADIQGAEADMLDGAKKTISNRLVRYWVISTHSDQLHQDCIKKLEQSNYKVLCEADVSKSMHVDGFIVARAQELPGPDKIQIETN
ncbi:MAG: FkbM family methyltransferase [Bdellovibrionales bacterium]